MPKRTSRANAAKLALSSKVEDVFRAPEGTHAVDDPDYWHCLAEAAIALANMAYNMTRWRWLNGRAASA